jgi:hypothetical protein
LLRVADQPAGSALLRRLVSQSDRIVVGRVIAADAQPFGPRGERGIHTRIELQVERSLIGSNSESVRFWVQGGRWGDRLRRVSGQATFKVGETVAVFLRARPDGELFPSAMGEAKWQVDVFRGVLRQSSEEHSLRDVEALLRETR